MSKEPSTVEELSSMLLNNPCFKEEIKQFLELYHFIKKDYKGYFWDVSNCKLVRPSDQDSLKVPLNLIKL